MPLYTRMEPLPDTSDSRFCPNTTTPSVGAFQIMLSMFCWAIFIPICARMRDTFCTARSAASELARDWISRWSCSYLRFASCKVDQILLRLNRAQQFVPLHLEFGSANAVLRLQRRHLVLRGFHGLVRLHLLNLLVRLLELRPALFQVVFLFTGVELNHNVPLFHTGSGFDQVNDLQKPPRHGRRHNRRSLSRAKLPKTLDLYLYRAAGYACGRHLNLCFLQTCDVAKVGAGGHQSQGNKPELQFEQIS